VRYASEDNWQIRMSAVRGLAWRDDTRSVAAVEKALTDPQIDVRLEAMSGVDRRDAARGQELYRRLLKDSSLTPAQRAKVGKQLRPRLQGP
jgi:hypothetical protein